MAERKISKKNISEIRKAEKYNIVDVENNIKEIVFPHTIRVGLTNNILNATISGSIHHTHEGKSYLVAGDGVTITSGSNGQVTIESSGGGSSSLTIKDEGVDLATSATSLDFVGSGVTATGGGADKTITIDSGITVQDEGSTLSTTATTLNFVGSNISATGTGATKTITVSAGASTTTQHVHNFHLGFSPAGGLTQTYYGKWNDSSIQNTDPDQAASNFVWKYYPYGGEIKKVYAIGSSRGDSDDNFPTVWQSRDIVFAIYNFEDTDGAGADVGGSTVERVPKYHVTASYSGGDFDLLISRKTGSTTRYKRCGVTFDLSSGTGSTTVSAGDAIAFGFKGEDTGKGPFEYMQFFIEWDENIS